MNKFESAWPPVCAYLQGWTSTAWLVANAELVPRHTSPIFTAAISHISAFAVLFAVAIGDHVRTSSSWSNLGSNARRVPHKIAFLGGLGWASTIAMVAAAPRLGVAVSHVLVVSGEVLTASMVDLYRDHGANSILMVFSMILVMCGVVLSVWDEAHSGHGHSKAALPAFGLAAFGCGMCLVLNSLGTTHTRAYIGAANASTCSAFTASLANAVIWAWAEIGNVAHFRNDLRPSTLLLWAVVGLASTWNVFVSTVVPVRIGFASTFFLAIAGKLSAGLVVDALGLFSVKRRPVTWLRAFGVGAVFLGALLLKARHFSERPYSKMDSSAAEQAPGEAMTLGKSSEDEGDIELRGPGACSGH